MMINFQVHPLLFMILLISNVFIKIHEYANLIICISDQRIKVSCLNIKLISSFNV